VVNYMKKIYRIRLARCSFEGRTQDEDTYVTLMRLEHEFEKYSTDEPVERSPSIARIPTRLQILYTN
jgi:hypothetical protein